MLTIHVASTLMIKLWWRIFSLGTCKMEVVLCSAFHTPHHIISLTCHQQVSKGRDVCHVPLLIVMVSSTSFNVCVSLSLTTFCEKAQFFPDSFTMYIYVTVLSPVLYFSNQIFTRKYFKTHSWSRIILTLWYIVVKTKSFVDLHSQDVFFISKLGVSLKMAILDMRMKPTDYHLWRSTVYPEKYI